MMTTKFFATAAVLLLAAGAPALADTGAADSAQATAKTDDDAGQNKVVCRRIESMGTRLGTKRVCRTKAEWAAEQAANRQDLDRAQNMRGARSN